MRGPDEHTHHMFSYLSPEQWVPADHPLRAVRALTDHALKTMSRRLAGLYAKTGRPSIPPEQLLRALVLQVLYTVRSEQLLMEELNYNLLFRWFVGLNMDDPVWHPTTFTKNRDRLLAGDVAAAFFDAVRAQARAAGLLSDEHFTVDGTQLEAWASLKSFQQRDAKPGEPPDDPGNPTVNFHGERRRNDTHASTTDPEALLHRKGPGKEATLAYLGDALLDHRHGLVANVCATHATGTAERDAAVVLLEASAPPGSTVAADKGYDVASFVATVRGLTLTPHVAQKARWSAIDGRTTRHVGYHVSQRKRTNRRPANLSSWSRSLGGCRPSAACASSDIAASNSWIGSSPSQPRRITWSGCGTWRRQTRDRRPPVAPVCRRSPPIPVRRPPRSVAIRMTRTESAANPSSSAPC